MKIKGFEQYYVANDEGSSGCIIRTFCKLYDQNYKEVYRGLTKIVKEKKALSYTEEEVYEEYMKQRDTLPIKLHGEVQVKDLDLPEGSYAIYCSDKVNWNHLIPLVDGIVYDKNDDCMNLYVLKVFKKN